MKRIISFIFVLLLIIPGIVIAQKPIAKFTPLIDTLCGSPNVEYFTDLSANNPTSWKWYFPGATPDTSTLRNPTNITYNGYGCYTVKLVVTNNNGSDSLTKNNAVCLYTIPKVRISGGEICQGGGSLPDTITALNFRWPDGKTDSIIDISAIISHTYTMQIKNGPCFSDTSITIIVDSMPSVLFKGDTLICVGDSTTIYALNDKGLPGNGYTYLWSTGSTADSIVIDGKAPGIYAYYLTVSKGGCTKDSSEIKIGVHYCVGGIESYFNSLGIEIFPNPVTNQLSVISDNYFDGDALFIVTDVTGRKVKNGMINHTQSKFTVDVSSLSPAIYFLQLQTDRGIAVKKFVKE